MERSAIWTPCRETVLACLRCTFVTVHVTHRLGPYGDRTRDLGVISTTLWPAELTGLSVPTETLRNGWQGLSVQSECSLDFSKFKASGALPFDGGPKSALKNLVKELKSLAFGLTQLKGDRWTGPNTLSWNVYYLKTESIFLHVASRLPAVEAESNSSFVKSRPWLCPSSQALIAVSWMDKICLAPSTTIEIRCFSVASYLYSMYFILL